MNYSNFIPRVFALFLLMVAFSASGAILKRFDAPEPKQDGYLKFFRPPALALRVPNPIPADRYNLLFLPVLSIESNASESNATIVAPPASTTEVSSVEVPKSTFPIVAPPVVVTPPVVLPPSDPFDVPANREPSTDDLIDALEREQIKSSVGIQGFLPFIPPYSAAPANLEIRSEAKYIRTPRQ
ncbi:MAG: hypothetical protein HOA16_08515 [Opitutae bacterium]|nr:hypothetical protein [Opitutae bacterium]